jgi:hypothetical protein
MVACQDDFLTRGWTVHELGLDALSHALADEAEKLFVGDTERLGQTPSLAVNIDHHPVAPAVETADFREHRGRPGAIGKFAAECADLVGESDRFAYLRKLAGLLQMIEKTSKIEGLRHCHGGPRTAWRERAWMGCGAT